jgi:hypothetical protein
MSQSKIRPAGELLAAAGVVASLVFVGVEIRQNTAAVRGATYQAIAEGSVSSAQWLASDERIADFIVRLQMGAGPDDFSPQENMALAGLYHSVVRRAENVYLQVSQGLIPQRAYQHFRTSRQIFASAHFDDFWREAREDYDPEFVRFFESEYLE